MLRIVWKNFIANIRNFLLFFCSVILSVNVLFLLMYIQEAAGHIKGIETEALAFAYSSELAKQLRMVIPAVIFVTVIVTAYSVKFYIQSRMKDYGLLVIFGIRKKDMKNIIIMEYTISCLLSCIIGLVTGRIFAWILEMILRKSAGESFAGAISMNRVYLMTLAMCVVMIAGAVLAVFIILDSKGTDNLIKASVVKEKRGTTWKSLLCLAAGSIMVCLSVCMVKKNPMSANIALFVLCLGIFISICFGLGYLLERYRKSDRYCLKILEWNQFYHYFNKNKFKILVPSILGIVLIHFSFLMLRGTLDSRLMPNDFVCIEKETGNFEKVFSDKFQGSALSFPFVWVNEAGGDSWIGMSVSDYNRLYGKQEKLKQDEVIRIWRIEGTTKDMADNSVEKKMEGIDLGKCRNSDTEEGARYTYQFQVKKEKIDEMIGFSMSGVIVMADEVLKEAVESGGFHQRFLIFNVDESRLNAATEFIQEQKDKGKLEEAFCRKTIEETDLKECILNRLIVAIVAFTLLFFSVFVMWLMMLAELEQNRKKYDFLLVMGVRKSRAGKILNKELGRTILASVVITVGVAAVFWKVFIDTYYSGMKDLFDKAGAEKLLLAILAVYAGSEFLFLAISRGWLGRQVLGGK